MFVRYPGGAFGVIWGSMLCIYINWPSLLFLKGLMVVMHGIFLKFWIIWMMCVMNMALL